MLLTTTIRFVRLVMSVELYRFSRLQFESDAYVSHS